MDQSTPQTSSSVDLAIIGAGAAGLAAAIFAAEQRHRHASSFKILLLDGAKKPGAKILVSGGGRCNVTNVSVTEHDYCGGSPNIIRNVLRRFDEHATARWMETLGVALKTEPPGKLFPVTDSARTVLEALMTRTQELGVETRFGFRVADVRQTAEANDSATQWLIRSVHNETITARRIILATGGKALPKSGSDGAAYAWLERLGHTIIPPVPSLAPLILDERGIAGSPLSHEFASLSGLTLNARLSFYPDSKSPKTGKASNAHYDGSLLFTHFGLSGPAAMNLSRHIARHRHEKPGDGLLTIGFELPGIGFPASMEAADNWLLQAAKQSPRASVTGVLSHALPERLAALLASPQPQPPASATPHRDSARLSDLTRQQRQHLAQLLFASLLAVKGDRGFSFAEATAGGVALDEINWRTMESRKAPGLYLCGEVLDVDGRIGGFNFQWAWASGHIAGITAVAPVK